MELIFLITALTLNAAANVLMRVGARNMPALEGLSLVDKGLAVAGNWALVLGLIFFASNVLFYILALRKINISVAYPIMTAGGLLIISVVSWFALGERLTNLQIGGISVIAVGMAMIAYHRG